MGLRDVLLGRKKLAKPARERLFALTTAAVTLDVELGLKTAGVGGICFKPVSASEFTRVESDIEQLLDSVAAESGSKLLRRDDSFGYSWVVVQDADLEDQVTAAHAVAQIPEQRCDEQDDDRIGTVEQPQLLFTVHPGRRQRRQGHDDPVEEIVEK